MVLYLVRHGQSTNNAIGNPRMGRLCDPPLTELGMRQAEFVADHLAAGVNRDPINPSDEAAGTRRESRGHGITMLYTSPMLRALQTAQPIGRALGLTPRVWIDLHEQGGLWLDHGEPKGLVGYPGLSRPEVLSRFPGYDLPDALSVNGWWNGGMEGREAAAERASRLASAMRLRASETVKVAAVTHAGFSNLLLASILGLPPHAPNFFHFANAGLTFVRFLGDGKTDLSYVNRCEFLPPELIT